MSDYNEIETNAFLIKSLEAQLASLKQNSVPSPSQVQTEMAKIEVLESELSIFRDKIRALEEKMLVSLKIVNHANLIGGTERSLAYWREKNQTLIERKERDQKNIIDQLDELALYDACLYGGRKDKKDRRNPNYVRPAKRNYIARCAAYMATWRSQQKPSNIDWNSSFIHKTIETLDNINRYMDGTKYLKMTTNFEDMKKDIIAGNIAITSELVDEITQFLEHVKQLLTIAHDIHNKQNLNERRLCFRNRRTFCPFCENKFYGPRVGDDELVEVNQGRPCIVKPHKQQDGCYFATGCGRRLELVPKQASELFELISLDSKEPRFELVDGHGYYDLSLIDDPDIDMNHIPDSIAGVCRDSSLDD